MRDKTNRNLGGYEDGEFMYSQHLGNGVYQWIGIGEVKTELQTPIGFVKRERKPESLIVPVVRIGRVRD